MILKNDKTWQRTGCEDTNKGGARKAGARVHLFAAQHDSQNVCLHDADEVCIRALSQRLVLVGIAASIVYPAEVGTRIGDAQTL